MGWRFLESRNLLYFSEIDDTIAGDADKTNWMDLGLVYDDIISYWQMFPSNSTPEATYEGHKIEGNFEKLEHYALKRKDKK